MTLINKPPVRTQGDMRQHEFSKANQTHFDGTRDLTRQEFKDETNINTILKRHGVDGITLRQPKFGEQDFDMDLQQAMQSIDAADRMMRKLPKPVRDKFGTWQNVLNAAADGTLNKELADWESSQTAAARRAAKKADRDLDDQIAIEKADEAALAAFNEERKRPQKATPKKD